TGAGDADALISERGRSLPGDRHAWTELAGDHEAAGPWFGGGFLGRRWLGRRVDRARGSTGGRARDDQADNSPAGNRDQPTTDTHLQPPDGLAPRVIGTRGHGKRGDACCPVSSGRSTKGETAI